jgi:DNA polymerase III subunit epsilon
MAVSRRVLPGGSDGLRLSAPSPSLGVMTGPLAALDVVVVDVETTGWLADQAAITEIGAVRLNGGVLTGEFSSLIRPHGPIPPEITELTGITDEMVSGAPRASAALRAFLAFARDCVLVAHNAPFDVGFLAAACTASDLRWPSFAVIDTAVLARLLLGPEDVTDCKLSTLAGYFGARTAPCHRALADAKATADVLAGLIVLAASRRAGSQTLRYEAPVVAPQESVRGELVVSGGEQWSPQLS